MNKKRLITSHSFLLLALCLWGLPWANGTELYAEGSHEMRRLDLIKESLEYSLAIVAPSSTLEDPNSYWVLRRQHIQSLLKEFQELRVHLAYPNPREYLDENEKNELIRKRLIDKSTYGRAAIKLQLQAGKIDETNKFIKSASFVNAQDIEKKLKERLRALPKKTPYVVVKEYEDLLRDLQRILADISRYGEVDSIGADPSIALVEAKVKQAQTFIEGQPEPPKGWIDTWLKPLFERSKSDQELPTTSH